MSPQGRLELPPQAIQHIAETLRKGSDRQLEIALNPAELGRVRMMLSTTEAGIVVAINAERPETLDLMRRNASDLGDTLRDLGYEDVAFSFGQGEQSQNGQNDSDAHPNGDDAHLSPHIQVTDTPIIAPAKLAIAPETIDMRF